MRLRLLPFLAFLTFLALQLAGCGDVENVIDCNDICEDAEDCFGEDFDRSDCIDACEDQPDSEIDECDACLDSEGMGCAECTLQCAPLGF